MITREQAICIFYCEPCIQDNAKKFSKIIGDFENIKICYYYCIMVKVIEEKVETKIKKQFEYFLRLIFISVLSLNKNHSN